MNKYKKVNVSIAHELESQLVRQFGVVLDGEALRRVFVFRTAEAFARAERNGMLGVPVFRIPHRTGCFALARDVALRFATLRESQRLRNGLKEMAASDDLLGNGKTN